jgi:biotin carboxyl carrier protein
LSKDSEPAHRLTIDGRTWRLAGSIKGNDTFKIQVENEEVVTRIIREPEVDQPELVSDVNGRMFVARILGKDRDQYVVRLNGRTLRFSLDSAQPVTRDERKSHEFKGPVLVSAPMSGRVVSLNISPNSPVASGQSLVVLEAMKMQNDIAAPKAGVVMEVYVQPGALVKAGDKLCLLN